MNEHYYKLLNETVLVHLLWLIPLLILIFLYAGLRRNTLLRRIAGERMLPRVKTELSRRKRFIKALLLVVAVALGVFALSRPAWNPQEIVKNQQGRDVVFLLDVSRSMQAEDLRPSRLEAAKIAIAETIDSIEGDRVGLVAFAGNAKILCPLTIDYSFFKTALDEAGAESVDVGGTMLSDAMRKAVNDLLTNSEAENKDIIIITDGGDEDEADDKFALVAAREAAEQGIRIITIGIGDETTGKKIPYTDSNGVKQYLQYQGKDVVSKLNAPLLRRIAKATPGGAYVNVGTSAFDFPSIYTELVGMAAKSDLGESKVVMYSEGFVYVLLAALVLLIFEFMLNERRGKDSREV